jgi:hypothetical protein
MGIFRCVGILEWHRRLGMDDVITVALHA